MTVLNPLRWHDLPLAYRLHGQGMSFDLSLSITVGDDLARQALLTGTGRTQAYILRHQNRAGLGVLYFRAPFPTAHLAYLSPALGEDEEGVLWLWLHLIDGLIAAAGERGVTTLMAEVDETADALIILRHSGFSVAERWGVWLRQPGSPPAAEGTGRLTKAERTQIELAHSQVVKGSLRDIVPPPIDAEAVYVLPQPGSPAMGIAAAYQGVRGALLDLYPGEQPIEEALLNELLSEIESENKLIYCRCRGHLPEQTAQTLEGLGFRYYMTQAVMLRHTAHLIKYPAFEQVSSTEGAVLSH